MRENKFRNCSIEYRPVHDLFNLAGWEYHIDEEVKPTWLDSEHRSRVQKELEKDFNRYCQLDSTYIFPGDLDLSSLKQFQPGSTIIADGAILLDNLVVLPPKTTLIAKRHGVTLRSVKKCYEDVTIIAPEVKSEYHDSLRHANIIDSNYARKNHRPSMTNTYGDIYDDRFDAIHYMAMSNQIAFPKYWKP